MKFQGSLRLQATVLATALMAAPALSAQTLDELEEIVRQAAQTEAQIRDEVIAAQARDANTDPAALEGGDDSSSGDTEAIPAGTTPQSR